MKAALMIVFAAATCLQAAAHPGPHPEEGIAFEQHVGARVPLGLPFVDARGEHATLGDALAHKPAVLLLGYVACKDLCATTLPGVAEALDHAGLRAGRDYRAVFASIDSREGSDVLAGGLQRIPAHDRDGWRFLGADDASVRVLARTVGFRYRYERDRDAFAHPEGIVVLSPDGVVSRYFFGVRFDPADLRLALAEAGQGRTGALADRLLLLCYHFDPASGRYTARIVEALRLLGAACLAAFAFAGWRMWRRRAPEARAP